MHRCDARDGSGAEQTGDRPRLFSLADVDGYAPGAMPGEVPSANDYIELLSMADIIPMLTKPYKKNEKSSLGRQDNHSEY